MTSEDLKYLFEGRFTQLNEAIVAVCAHLNERHLPVVAGLMMTLHGWMGDNVEPWHADLLRQADESGLLGNLDYLRAQLQLCDEMAAKAQAALETIHSQQPAAAPESSKA